MVELDYEMLELGPGGASGMEASVADYNEAARMNTNVESGGYNAVRFVGLSDGKFLKSSG